MTCSRITDQRLPPSALRIAISFRRADVYEAVAQGLAALRKSEWVEGVEERFGMVKVSVAEVRVEHQVKIADFMKWLERPGRTPREVSQRHNIRAILGMSASR